MKYAFISEHAGQWSVNELCDFLGVSRSAYYHAIQKPGSKRVEDDDRLSIVIRSHFDLHRGRYGSPRIAKEMRETGYRISDKRVARLMREMGLVAHAGKRFKPQTTRIDPANPIAPDLIRQDFSAEKPNEKWVGDITYIRCQHGFTYLATVIDLYSRKVVGWAIANSMETELIIHALRMAVAHRRPGPGVIFHSDRGSQYTSDEFRTFCTGHKIRQSMGRTGCCYDNAAAESFFHTLKVELLRDSSHLTDHQIRLEVMSYIEGYYNSIRRHSSIELLAPDQFELQGIAA